MLEDLYQHYYQDDSGCASRPQELPTLVECAPQGLVLAPDGSRGILSVIWSTGFTLYLADYSQAGDQVLHDEKTHKSFDILARG